jgi:hypothetical protein
MLTAQEDETAMVDPQVVLLLKALLFVPLIAIDAMVTGTVPVLLIVTLCAALVTPVDCEAKVNDVGVTLVVGIANEAEIATVVVPPEAELFAITRLAV